MIHNNDRKNTETKVMIEIRRNFGRGSFDINKTTKSFIRI